ncbi:hypothetical protein TNCV_4298801 [Trichonephila clavipes]|nr:hypothetical protein TNCV_4298801 [Trichonephila clavipes]
MAFQSERYLNTSVSATSLVLFLLTRGRTSHMLDERSAIILREPKRVPRSRFKETDWEVTRQPCEKSVKEKSGLRLTILVDLGCYEIRWRGPTRRRFNNLIVLDEGFLATVLVSLKLNQVTRTIRHHPLRASTSRQPDDFEPRQIYHVSLGTRMAYGIGLGHVRTVMASQCEPFAWDLCAAESKDHHSSQVSQHMP